MWSDYVGVPQPAHSLGHTGCFIHPKCRITKEGQIKGLDKTDLVDNHKVFPEREFLIDNLLVQVHHIDKMLWLTGLAPWEF